MRIKNVTICGADDYTDINALIDLSKKYPFVEWGILFSPTKAGQERYPGIEWVKELDNAVSADLNPRSGAEFNSAPGINLSAHLCGGYSSDILFNGEAAVWHKDFGHLTTLFTRHQLNFNAAKFNAKIITPLLQFLDKQHQPVIIQSNDDNAAIIKNIMWRWHRKLDVHFLFDSSRGLGLEAKVFTHPVPGYLCGYAGGLGPDNLDMKLKEYASKLTYDTDIWIDMESGVRTGGYLDMSKVTRVLEIVEPYVYPEAVDRVSKVA